MVLRLTIFPTCVGVNLSVQVADAQQLHLPHVRGGEPFHVAFDRALIISSPRAWG